MDRQTLSRIDEELDSSEVAALRFLCLDFVNKKRLEKIRDAKDLFLRLEERGLLENHFFLHQLLNTIHRADLLNLLETDSRQPEETDSSPTLSPYRVMLYQLYENMTLENLERLKFLFSDRLFKREIEASDTALDLFVKMEQAGFLANNNLHELLVVLQQLDQQLVTTVQRYIDEVNPQDQMSVPPRVSMDCQRVENTSQPMQPVLSTPETQFIDLRLAENIASDAEPSRKPSLDAEPTLEASSLPDETEYYRLDHNPRGQCVIINNEEFNGYQLKKRAGTEEDAKALRSVFTYLGFKVVIHDNLTADAIRHQLTELGKNNFLDQDALVVCVLSHGEKGCIYGTDEQPVYLRDLTKPFISSRASTLAGKPKLFFIQACQGSDYQGGALPCPPKPREEEQVVKESLEEDAGPVVGETVPWDADFLLGMATVSDCRSFRNTITGSIYIQELCRQLRSSAESKEMDDILTVLTRVNRNVGKGQYLSHKQMPEPKYTLTKKLVLKKSAERAWLYNKGSQIIFFCRWESGGKTRNFLPRPNVLFGIMSRSDYPPGYDDSHGPLYTPQGGGYGPQGGGYGPQGGGYGPQGGGYPPPPAYAFPGYGGPQPGQPSAPYPTGPNTPLFPGQPGGYPPGTYSGQPHPAGPPGSGFPGHLPMPPVLPPTIPSDILTSNDTDEDGFAASGSGWDSLSIRHAFIRKVYLILACQLLITTAIVGVFTFVEPVKYFIQRNQALYWASYAVYFVTHMVLVCCKGPRRKFPWNIILLLIFVG
ncbi:caspase 8 [Solea senegalensis]|uniref:Caspase-8 n=1 Tax=Solea senegalensis TaxID=28829 RepID=A0AAV6PIV4_SOLSE|nr:caspase 8 [Solea senegalensis]